MIKMILSKSQSLLILTFLFFFFGCDNQSQEDPVILTEGVLFLSGEKVRLSGRIYSNGGEVIADHGFEIAENKNFEDAINVNIGERTTLGAFNTEYIGLISGQNYFYRAFAVISNSKIYGQVKSFTTLDPTLKTFEPKSAPANGIIKIFGTNFSSHTKVIFGGNEAQIIDIELESIMTVSVPSIGTETELNIRVLDRGVELVFDDKFQFVYGTWTAKGSTNNDYKFNDPLSFAKEGKFVFGLGRNLVDGTINSTMWEYNIGAETWVELSFAGTPTLGAFHNNGGYFGAGYEGWSGGFSQSPILSFDFWRYNNGVISYIGALPFNIYEAVSFYFNNSVYVTGGVFSKTPNYKFYKYSEASGNWILLKDTPILIDQNLPHFSYKNSHYFITLEGEIWEYKILLDVWEKLGEAPFEIGGKGVSEVINGKAYIGIFSFESQLWEYDIENNLWKAKTSIGDGSSNLNGGSYLFGSSMGVIRLNPSASSIDWIQSWEFDPEAY